MNHDNQKKVCCIGIGGGGVYYVAKYFLALGVDVYGFDLNKNDRTEELEKLGVHISYSNPVGKLEEGTTLFVYSPALPKEIITQLEKLNKEITHTDVGIFTTELVNLLEKNKLSEKELSAVKASNIAPLYTFDQSSMVYIGVTGTDGKTTTTTMIYHLLKELGYKPGLVSTVAAKIGDNDIDTGFHTTTPSAQELHKLLKMMVAEGCTHAVIETTSHALAMGRTAGLKFDVIGYTNITSDHLDYHKTWANYFAAKEKLITEHCYEGADVVFFEENKKVKDLLMATCKKRGLNTCTYGETADADVQATQIKETPTISFTINGSSIDLKILGRYNVFNSLAAVSVVSKVLELKPEVVAQKLKSFTPITGRMQIVQDKPYTVFVDFAHTANALEVTLPTAVTFKKSPENKVILVFGCAGNRDQSKRIPMGRIAGKYADITCLTAEDPRTEKLSDINNEVSKGWRETATKSHHLIRFDEAEGLVETRRSAIETALSLAQPGDVVFIAGKAHEQSLCFGTVEYPWNDIDETKKLLESERKR
jgi:UDP-N-acetylmuramoyl-L-alanyl-D-glutamate--2,6-diaminopimelate ligase